MLVPCIKICKSGSVPSEVPAIFSLTLYMVADGLSASLNDIPFKVLTVTLILFSFNGETSSRDDAGEVIGDLVGDPAGERKGEAGEPDADMTDSVLFQSPFFHGVASSELYRPQM